MQLWDVRLSWASRSSKINQHADSSVVLLSLHRRCLDCFMGPLAFVSAGVAHHSPDSLATDYLRSTKSE